MIQRMLQGNNMSLEKPFTSSGTPKIIDALLEYQNTDLTLTGIANKAGVHYTIRLKALPLLRGRAWSQGRSGLEMPGFIDQ
jgi:hypothetical protein